MFFRRRLVVVTLSSGAVAVMLGATPETNEPADAPRTSVVPAELERKAPHGALESERQVELLDGLQLPETADPWLASPYYRALELADNAPTPERIALGRRLYFDTRLSSDGSVACATCHDVSRGFTDRRAGSEGIGDKIGRRNAPTTMNAAFFQTQFWDGRSNSLEDQALLPIVNPIEMGHASGEAAATALSADPTYEAEFQRAYGRGVNYEDIGRAIAAFERTLIFLDAPFDRFVTGEPDAITTDAKAGWVLFNGKARCNGCHQLNGSNPIGTNNKFHNIGVSARDQDFAGLAREALSVLETNNSQEAVDRLALATETSQLGRFMVTRNRADIGAFKTQQLRNIGLTAPYMHDGTLRTLWDVMDHYNKGGEPNPYLDGGIEPLALTEPEIDQVVAFLFTLTDDRFSEQNASEVARQRAQATESRPIRDDERAARRVLPFERHDNAEPRVEETTP